MTSMASALLLVHLVGVALAVGCATVKLALLLRTRTDRDFIPTYLAVARPITRLIILGMALATASGIGWLLQGYQLRSLLIVKLVLVAAVWGLGPVIDNVIEPGFRRLATTPGEGDSPAFRQASRRYLLVEVVATGLFYLILAMWVLG